MVQSPEELGFTIGDRLYEADLYEVKVAHQGITGKQLAAQITKENKSSIDERYLEAVLKFEHPHLVKLHDVFTTGSAVFEIVDNVFLGNDLFEYIYTSPNMKLTERQAATITEQLLQALAYLHRLGFVHRNVRPDDAVFMVESLIEAPVVKLGTYCFLTKGTSTEFIGVPSYMAPEMMSGHRYGSKVDLWSLGVTLHMMLTGNLPFDHSDPPRLAELICNEQLKFRGTEWEKVSPGAIDLTMALLNKDPNRRCSAERALTHPWIVARGDLPTRGGCCKDGAGGGSAGGCCGGNSGGGGGGCCKDPRP